MLVEGKECPSSLGVIRDKAVLAMSFLPRRPPLIAEPSAQASSGPRPVSQAPPCLWGPALARPLELQHEGVVCVGLWGVNQSKWLATSPQGLWPVPQSPTTWLCGLTHHFIHSVHTSFMN